MCVDDTGVAGQAESVQIQTFDFQTYFVVVDASSTGGAPPGPSGPYTLTLSGSGGFCWPVELQKMSIE